MTDEQADKMISLLELISTRLGRIEDNLDDINKRGDLIVKEITRVNINLKESELKLIDIISNTNELTNFTSEVYVLDDIKRLLIDRG